MALQISTRHIFLPEFCLYLVKNGRFYPEYRQELVRCESFAISK